MKLGPVFAIPVMIKNYQNETISISLQSLDDITLDQTKVISHFENKPIFGIFSIFAMVVDSFIGISQFHFLQYTQH